MKKPSKPGDTRDGRDSRKPSLDVEAECTFRDLPTSEVKAACLYEYMRESQVLRETFNSCSALGATTSGRVLPRIVHTGTDSHPAFAGATIWGRVLPRIVAESFEEACLLWTALAEAGFPEPWNKLRAGPRANLVKLLDKAKNKELFPPIVIRELQAAYCETGWLSSAWKAMEPVMFDPEPCRNFFFGSIQIDEAYNKDEAAEAFKEWYASKYAKQKGGGSLGLTSKLNYLSALRVRHHVRNRKQRFQVLFKITGMNSYKPPTRSGKVSRGEEMTGTAFLSEEAKGLVDLIKRLVRQPEATDTADVVLHRSCDSAIAFFKTLFPSEIPLSADLFKGGES